METTQQILVSKSEAGNVVWCPVCAENVAAVTSEEAALMIGLSSRAIYQSVERGEVHFAESSEGLLLICVKSLSKDSQRRLP